MPPMESGSICGSICVTLMLLAGVAHGQVDTGKWAIALGSRRADRAQEASDVLRSYGPRATKDVLKAWKKISVPGRRSAAALLAEWSKDAATFTKHGTSIIRVAGDDDPTVRRTLAPALLYARSKHVSALCRLLISRHADTRAAAAAALAKVGPPSFAALEKYLDSKSKTRRAAGYGALVAFGPKAGRYSARIQAACADPEASVRGNAVRAAAQVLPDKQMVVRVLLKALEDPAPVVRAAAAESVTPVSDEIWPELLARLPTTIDAISFLAPKLHGTIATEAAKGNAPLLEALARVDWANTKQQGLPFDKLGSLATHKDPAVRRAFFGLLASTYSKVPKDVLGGVPAATKDADEGVRAAVYRVVVTRFRWSDAQEADLRRGLKDENPAVRAYCWYRLFQVGKPRPHIDVFAAAASQARTPGVIELAGLVRPLHPDLLELLTDVARDKDPRVASVAVRAIARIVREAVPGVPELRTARFAKLDTKTRKKAEGALDWLTRSVERTEDWAAWDCDKYGGNPDCDLGVTAMALLGYAAAGVTEQHPRHGSTVLAACRYLQRWQQKDGLIGERKHTHHVLLHAISTAALAEHAILSGGKSMNRTLEHAIKYLRKARNPSLAWRYRARPGDNDTFCTGWCIYALVAAEHATGIRSAIALQGGIDWFTKMTDPEFGQVGYNVAGGSPAFPMFKKQLGTDTIEIRGRTIIGRDRSVYSTTAIACWCRALVEPEVTKVGSTYKLGRAVVQDREPGWDTEKRDEVDYLYWAFGARLLCQAEPSKMAQRWLLQLNTMLTSVKTPGWEPIGAWGPYGGKVYTVGAGLMALLAPIYVDHGKTEIDKLRKVIEKAAKSRQPMVAAAAASASR